MINWKIRFKNPIFISQLLLSFIVPILGYFGLTAQDITTWASLFSLLVDAFSNPYVVVLVIISVWNAVTDPTTRGIKDSNLAKQYEFLKK
ncbi:phage holin [Cytobacillus horneckiae]|uniref:Phage holin n=1 Tax=Cytobacillus horneckiae TaxID=549687 RepID=A0A2N0ZB47_9BACI|nr:phage holin [Cytobacillus horneckiae]MEC1155528.1 phage holin [Cytobacillus horneckiae]MED2936847.1 phage holin [Cytobacillus horneckiae]PKG26733.1 phage holin [Cytobacillus horneckiae]